MTDATEKTRLRDAAFLQHTQDGGADTFDAGFEEGMRAAAEVIARRVRMSCTPSSGAYSKGGDFLVLAVADWIENPPEWVDAPWREGSKS